MQIVTRSQRRRQGQLRSEAVLKLRVPIINSHKNSVVAGIVEKCNEVIASQNRSNTLIAELVTDKCKLDADADSNYYNNLLTASLQCIERYYDELRINWVTQFMPKTPEEENIINLFIQTIQSTEKILKSNMLDAKRLRNFVIYTGMDAIEPESENEIIDIWADTTIKYDPDYVPSEDEDEDEDEDDEDEW